MPATTGMEEEADGWALRRRPNVGIAREGAPRRIVALGVR
jgi:hypothetical protein